MTNYRQTMADALEHMYLMREYKLMERELTDAEKKKREEIAQDMDDGDFKKQYGDRWKEVKMAVATKQAKNESVELNEGDPFFGPVKGRKVKTVNMTHKTSGKEVVVVDNPKKIKEMEKLGFVKEEADLDEKIKRDQSYFKSYSDAVTHALEYTKSRGYEVDEDDFAAKVTHGPRKPSEGKTVSQRIDVTKGGKPQKKQLSFQVYNKGGKNPYELNVYVEDVELDEAKQVLAHGGNGQYKAVSSGGVVDIMYKGKVISQGDFDRGADGWFLSIKGEKAQKFFDDAQEMVDYFAKNKITEEADLDDEQRDRVERLLGRNYHINVICLNAQFIEVLQ